VVFIVFADLAMSKSAAVLNYQRAKAKVEQLEAQKARLQRDLERAQNDQQVIPKGYEYFGQIPQGVEAVVAEPEAPAVDAAVEQAPSQSVPFWTELWRKLRQP